MSGQAHHILVWGPAIEGSRTGSGRILPAGWVWNCSCGAVGAGYSCEDAADDGAEQHEIEVNVGPSQCSTRV